MAIVLPMVSYSVAVKKVKFASNSLSRIIDTVIGLPANIFFGTGIPTVILILKQKRQNTDVLVVDASKHFMKEGKNNKLQASDIKRITDAVINRESIDKFSQLVSKQTLRDNGYNLNIPRYVDSSAVAES
jgi:type I restriction enzyme M protein